MMKHMFILFFFILPLLLSCETICKQESLINQTMSLHGESQEKKYGLSLIGMGSSIPDHKVKEAIVHYVVNKPMVIDEARNLFVCSAEDLLTLINSNVELRPYLDNYPFTIDNIDFMIGYRNASCKHYEPPFIALMYIIRGNIWYCFHDAQKDKFIKELDVMEPYSEARRIVLGE